MWALQAQELTTIGYTIGERPITSVKRFDHFGQFHKSSEAGRKRKITTKFITNQLIDNQDENCDW